MIIEGFLSKGRFFFDKAQFDKNNKKNCLMINVEQVEKDDFVLMKTKKVERDYYSKFREKFVSTGTDTVSVNGKWSSDMYYVRISEIVIGTRKVSVDNWFSNRNQDAKEPEYLVLAKAELWPGPIALVVEKVEPQLDEGSVEDFI